MPVLIMTKYALDSPNLSSINPNYTTTDHVYNILSCRILTSLEQNHVPQSTVYGVGVGRN